MLNMDGSPVVASPVVPSNQADETALQLDLQVCFSLYSTCLAMNRVYRQLLEPLQLTYPQYLVMLVLWQEDGLSVSAIGAKLYLDSATLTPLLKRLEQNGCIVRHRSTVDERARVILLTEQGRALQQQAFSIPAQVMCSAQCSAEDLVQLKQQLELIRHNFLLQF